MEIKDALEVFENYPLWLVIIGIAFMATTILPRVLSSYPMSMPMGLLILGFAVIALPLGLKAPNVYEQSDFIEHLTELGVIISLMGAGLKLDRPPSLKGWSSTWRLLGITMIVTIVLTALIGWWFVAFAPATAMLLGAVIAPTDPVLASEVQVEGPGEGVVEEVTDDESAQSRPEEELRFSLTSEAGLNDSLAFPFTNMALAMVIAGAHPENWIGSWFLSNVLYELGIAGLIGWGLGYLLARFLMAGKAESTLAKSMIGLGAIASTLLVYGITEYFGGYGFLATFIAAVILRHHEPDHPFHKPMHIFIEKGERIFTAILMLGLGAAIGGGLLEPLNWVLILSAIAIIFIVRPVSGIIGLLGFKGAPWREKLAISFLGIRGIGSLYYLSYALNQEDFSNQDEIWALVALVVVISVFVHGITGTPITQKLDKMRQREKN